MLTQEEVKQYIYKELLPYKDRQAAVAWSGGEKSGLIWFIARQELGINFKVIFADDDKQAIGLYTLINKTNQKYDLRLKKIFTPEGLTIMDALSLEVPKYDVVFTGRPLDWGYCPLPQDDRAVWNYLKTIRVPYYDPIKKSMLG